MPSASWQTRKAWYKSDHMDTCVLVALRYCAVHGIYHAWACPKNRTVVNVSNDAHVSDVVLVVHERTDLLDCELHCSRRTRQEVLLSVSHFRPS